MRTAPPYNEKYLLQLVAAGDEPSFKQLFYRYQNKLAAFVHRLGASRTDVQEIVQDVFIKIWTNRADLHNVENFESYLFVAARNHALNCFKKLARDQQRIVQWTDALENELPVMEEENWLSQYEVMITDAAKQLPEQQRKVYQLARQEGLQQAEIARILGLSKETVKKHMQLALRSIRNYLSEHINGRMVLLIALIEAISRD